MATGDLDAAGLHCGWIVDSDGVVSELVASHKLSAGYDLLTDAGVGAEKAATIVATVEQDGKDPEAFARHFLKLRAAAMGIDRER